MFLFCRIAFPQTQNTADSQEFQITIKSQIVVLDTVVIDRKGEVVTNLKRDDFQAYEDGVLQAIRDFDAPSGRPLIPDSAWLDHNGNDDWGDSPLTMIVIDEMDTPFTEIAYAKQSVERYLKGQAAKLLEPTILLWLNDNGMHPVTQFTRDRDSILKALSLHPPSNASKLAKGAAVEQIAMSFAALQQAALFSRGHPGKKEILWVGRSFPAINAINLDAPDKELLGKALRSTTDLLLASRVSLYVVDPMLGTSSDSDSSSSLLQGVPAIAPLSGSKITDPFERGFDINVFVQQTGGKYYRGMNDLEREINESVQRGIAFYTFTYIPHHSESSDVYHSIEVRMNDPNLTAQTKQGYYANATKESQQAKQDMKQGNDDLRFDLYEATTAGMQYTGLGLHVRQCQRDKDSVQATCNILVDSGPLTFSSAGPEKEQTVLLAVISSLDAKGKILNQTAQQLTLGISVSETSLIRNGNISLILRTLVPQGSKRVKVVLRDVTGRIGTAEVNTALVPSLISSDVAGKGER